MRNIRLAVRFSLVCLLLTSFGAMAQRRVELLNFTTTSWKYFTNGTDLGTAWRAPAYNDSAWPMGMGLLGVETTPGAYPYPFNTTFAAYDNNIITYYFRAHFNLSAADNKFPMSLVASNFADDGCAIYLNGNLAGTARVTPNSAYNVVATGGPATEGQYEVFLSFPTNGLVTGDNVVAVEVKQNATGSSDIVHGMSLWAIVPTTITITTLPVSQSVIFGAPFMLSVGISGGPAVYQWQTNNGSGVFVNIPGAAATFATLTNTANWLGARQFRVVCSNGVNTAISSIATVTSSQDVEGPVPISATVLEEPGLPGQPGRTNRIEIVFNEGLLASTVHSVTAPAILTNGTFRVVMLASNLTVDVTNSAYNPGTFPLPGVPPKVTLTMVTNMPSRWHYRSNYYILFNNIKDSSRSNAIAPNTIIPVSWPMTTNILDPNGTSQAWYYHTSFLYERNPNFPPTIDNTGPNVYTSAWTSITYTGHLEQPTYWASTFSPRMTFELSATSICFTNAPREGISFQEFPSLFRTTFMWPTNTSVSTNVDLTFDYGADDGAAFFLNGVFLFSDTNFPAGPITDATRTTSPSEGACKNRVVQNVALRRGSNVLAVAVAQFNSEGDSGFVCKLDARTYSAGSLPPTLAQNIFTNLLKRTNIVRQANTTRIFWPSNCYGCSLVFRTNVNSGPWIQEPMQSNPFIITNPATAPRKFYRLQRLQTNGFPNMP